MYSYHNLPWRCSIRTKLAKTFHLQRSNNLLASQATRCKSDASVTWCCNWRPQALAWAFDWTWKADHWGRPSHHLNPGHTSTLCMKHRKTRIEKNKEVLGTWSYWKFAGGCIRNSSIKIRITKLKHQNQNWKDQGCVCLIIESFECRCFSCCSKAVAERHWHDLSARMIREGEKCLVLCL